MDAKYVANHAWCRCCRGLLQWPECVPVSIFVAMAGVCASVHHVPSVEVTYRSLGPLFTEALSACYLKIHMSFGATRLLRRVQKTPSLVEGRFSACCTKITMIFWLVPKSLWCKKWQRRRSDTKQPHSDTKTTDTKTQDSHNDTRQQRPFSLRGNNRSWP